MDQHVKQSSSIYLYKNIFFIIVTIFFIQTAYGAAVQPPYAEKLCVQHMKFLSKQFKQVIRPRHKILFHQSMRSKKYKSTLKDFEDLKKYIKNKNFIGRPKMDCDDIFHYIHDKILWIDDFHGGALEYFSSPYYAEIFFRKNRSIFNIHIEGRERKEIF